MYGILHSGRKGIGFLHKMRKIRIIGSGMDGTVIALEIQKK